MAEKEKNKLPAMQDTGRDSKGRFVKGVSGNPKGSQPGGASVKREILSCFELKKFLVWAKEHESEFYQIIVKLLPKELHSTGDPGIVINIQQQEVVSLEQANAQAKSRLGAEVLN